VHFVPYDGTAIAYSAIPFDEKSEAWIHGFLDLYFEKIKEMIQKTDIDILSHLTCPLRYINGKYGRGVSLDAHLPAIREILSLIIARSIALEVNTSGLDYGASGLMPPVSILSLYRDMGGKLVTLGSDAHAASRLAFGFEEAKKHLRAMGFTSYLAYQKREARSIAL
jgi:histidinol-phosphatase (PHP family)